MAEPSRDLRRAYRVLTIVVAAYIAAQLLADVASLRILSIGGLSVDGGTLIYPFTFTIRDLVHKTAGKQVARMLIFLAAAINLAMAGVFKLVAALPADLEVGTQAEFGAVLAPVWTIVAASVIAEVIAELIDTEVYQRWVERFGERWQWGRVLASNAVAVPIDSALFVWLAFGGLLPGSEPLATAVLMSIFWANVFVKGAVTLVSIPWIYLVKPSPLPQSETDRSA
ncbi:MAG: queuosine precursor transporter [Acidimicrobiia bacterium]|nr:queuosine precursor transporter [Acidimicrobiia bacterium]